eukprot:SAG31_NODE_838_length_11617_cov_36.512936_15_plen_136_part_00
MIHSDTLWYIAADIVFTNPLQEHSAKELDGPAFEHEEPVDDSAPFPLSQLGMYYLAVFVSQVAEATVHTVVYFDALALGATNFEITTMFSLQKAWAAGCGVIVGHLCDRFGKPRAHWREWGAFNDLRAVVFIDAF